MCEGVRGVLPSPAVPPPPPAEAVSPLLWNQFLYPWCRKTRPTPQEPASPHGPRPVGAWPGGMRV